MARFREMKVFPAPSLKEVKVMTCIGWSFFAINDILVRKIRKASDTMLFPLSASSSEPCFPSFRPSLSKGISPKNGTLNASSNSFLPRTRVSRNRIIRQATAGKAMPINTPNRRMRFRRGEIGALLPSALSMTRALLSAIAWESAFSSRRFNKKR